MPKTLVLVTPTEISGEMVEEWVVKHPLGELDRRYGGRFTRGDALIWIDLDPEVLLYYEEDIEQARLALGGMLPSSSIQLTVRYDEGSEELSKEIMEEMKAMWGGLTTREIFVTHD